MNDLLLRIVNFIVEYVYRKAEQPYIIKSIRFLTVYKTQSSKRGSILSRRYLDVALTCDLEPKMFLTNTSKPVKSLQEFYLSIYKRLVSFTCIRCCKLWRPYTGLILDL